MAVVSAVLVDQIKKPCLVKKLHCITQCLVKVKIKPKDKPVDIVYDV